MTRQTLSLKPCILVLASCALMPLSAMAGEFMVGGFAHDVTFIGKTIGVGVVGPEQGSADIELGYRSDPLKSWTYIWQPQAYGLISVNDKGKTSFASVGLAWKLPITAEKTWYVRPGLGLAYQNKYASLPDFRAPGLSQQEQLYDASLRQKWVQFGSKILFEPEISLGHQFKSGDAVELSWTHISNGEILAHGENQGMDDLGIRYIHRF